MPLIATQASAIAISFLSVVNGQKTPTDTKYPAEVTVLRIDGLDPAQTYTIHTSSLALSGKANESHVDFKPDAAGVVETDTAVPVSGTYDKADADGPFWSMVEVDQPTIATPQGVVEVSVSIGTTLLQSASVKIGYFKPGVRSIDLAGTGLVGRLYLPAETGPHPAIIAFGGSEGDVYGGELDALALANEGFVALGIGYFSAPGLPSDLANIPLEYFETAIKYLQSRPEVNGSAIGVMGCSRGGELALLLGATFPDIKAVVGQVPSPFRFGGNVDPDSSGHTPPAWTHNGKALPYIDYQGQLVPMTLPDGRVAYSNAPAFVKGLERDPNMVYAAMTAIEKTNGPVLMYGGDDDQMWPSCLLTNMAIARLRATGHPFADEAICYQNAGHGLSVLPAYAPTTETTMFEQSMNKLMNLGGTPEGNALGQRQAWTATLRFLRKNLR